MAEIQTAYENIQWSNIVPTMVQHTFFWFQILNTNKALLTQDYINSARLKWIMLTDKVSGMIKLRMC